VATLRNNFINGDSDRFRVWVRDPMNKNTGQITIHVQTSSDAGNDVILKEVPGEPGVFLSNWLLLTSVNVDKRAAGASGFLVQLGDTVTARYGANQDEATVPIQKVVTLHINILNVAKGQPATTPVKALIDVLWANRIYASAGILFKPFIETVNPPAKVDLSDGFQWRFIYGSKLPSSGKFKLTPEETALLGDASLRQGNNTEIVVYYVNFLANKDNRDSGGFGESFYPLRDPDPKYDNSIIISADDEKYQTLAHEIGHVLLDNGNHTGGIIYLMTDPPQVNGTATDSRRILDGQAVTMRGSKLAVAPQ
jgi:hypothetical protein